MQNKHSKPASRAAVECSALLDRRRMGTKSRDYGFGSALGTVDNSEKKLGKMKPYPGVVAILVDALKKKGMRFKEVSFKNGDITNNDKNVVIFRGDAAKVLHRAFHGCPCSVAAHHASHDLRLPLSGDNGRTGHDFHLTNKRLKFVHKRSLSNSYVTFKNDGILAIGAI